MAFRSIGDVVVSVLRRIEGATERNIGGTSKTGCSTPRRYPRRREDWNGAEWKLIAGRAYLGRPDRRVIGKGEDSLVAILAYGLIIQPALSDMPKCLPAAKRFPCVEGFPSLAVGRHLVMVRLLYHLGRVPIADGGSDGLHLFGDVLASLYRGPLDGENLAQAGAPITLSEDGAGNIGRLIPAPIRVGSAIATVTTGSAAAVAINDRQRRAPYVLRNVVGLAHAITDRQAIAKAMIARALRVP